MGQSLAAHELGLRSTKELIDVRWLGAKGDGKTDDTDALLRAVDTNQPLSLSPGTYLVSQTLELDYEGAGLLSHVRSKAGAGKAVLKWNGASGGGPIVRVRNTPAGELRNICFDGANLARTCLQFKHTLGDVDIVTHWTAYGCSFSNAREYNVEIGSADQVAGGDNSGLAFFNCLFGRSFLTPGAQTIAHVAQWAAETFQTSFYSPRFYGWNGDGGRPLYAYYAQGGQADFHSAIFENIGTADIFLESRAATVLPSVNVFGAESQTSGMFLKTTFHDGGGATIGNAGQRPCVLAGVYHIDFLGAESSESIHWEGWGHTALVLVGGHYEHDIFVHANARACPQGLLFDDVDGEFTGTGKVCGTWWKATRFYQRFPDMPEYANEAAALAAGLKTGDLYRTAAGVVMVKL